MNRSAVQNTCYCFHHSRAGFQSAYKHLAFHLVDTPYNWFPSTLQPRTGLTDLNTHDQVVSPSPISKWSFIFSRDPIPNMIGLVCPD